MCVNLTTTYLGMRLRNPLVASASPLTGDATTAHQLEQAGAAAIVMPSLFEEQIVRQELYLQQMDEYGTESTYESLTFFPEVTSYNSGPKEYVRRIEDLKHALRIPVISSLNGVTPGGWTRYAQMIEDAGADALELNTYDVVTDPNVTAADVEAKYLKLVAEVRAEINIPLAVKLSPFFTALPAFARRLVDAGANGLVLFNRFVQPDIDLEMRELKPHLALSHRGESLLPMRWIAILRDQVTCSLAATGGAHCADDVLKLLLAGADVVMMASTLLARGTPHLHEILEGVDRWLETHEYRSVAQMKGSMSRQNCPDPAGFERSNYMKALVSYSGRV